MPRKPPKLSTAYETLPLTLSIMTRSIDPILVLSVPYTAVPSTLSLPIRDTVSLSAIVRPPVERTGNRVRRDLFLRPTLPMGSGLIERFAPSPDNGAAYGRLLKLRTFVKLGCD